jgi:2-iminobutanoate/2-iminopropanoate deaminase
VAPSGSANRSGKSKEVEMKKTLIRTEKGFLSPSPLSQAVKAGGFTFISGQVPVETRKVVSEDFAVQTRFVLDSLKGIAEAAGASLAQVVKTTVFLTDMSRFEEMNRIYLEYFPEEPPARTCIGVKELPRSSQIEIEAVALG